MKKSEPFRVPSLGDVDAVYKDLQSRRAALTEKKSEIVKAHRKLEAELGERPTLPYSSRVAELLGEDTDAASENAARVRLKELSAEIRDVEIAIGVIDRRIAEQKPKANTAAVDACRDEYGRRVRAMVEAFRAVQAAREAYDELRFEFDRNDIQWTRLGPMSPNFLGDARDGHVQRFMAEAKGYGYVT